MRDDQMWRDADRWAATATPEEIERNKARLRQLTAERPFTPEEAEEFPLTAEYLRKGE